MAPRVTPSQRLGARPAPWRWVCARVLACRKARRASGTLCFSGLRRTAGLRGQLGSALAAPCHVRINTEEELDDERASDRLKHGNGVGASGTVGLFGARSTDGHTKEG